MFKPMTSLAVLAAALFGVAVAVSPASAAIDKHGKQEKRVLKAVARLAPSYAGIKVRGSKVSMTLSGLRYSNVRHGVFRSGVNKKFYRVDLVPREAEPYVAVVQKRGQKFVLRAWDTRWDMADTLCKRKRPTTAVVYDLALDPVDRLSSDGRCRHPRNPSSMTRAMNAAEIASLRAAYERVLDPDTFEYRSSKEPDFSEVSSSCDWEEQGQYSFEPYGRVSKTDPRFALLHIGCITGSVDGVAALNVTDLLVSRSGKSGPFSNLLAHVIPGSSPMSSACATDRTWPIPYATRVSLEFCLPFPVAIRNFLGRSSL